MTRPLATRTTASPAPAAAGAPSRLMVMALRAAEQHVLVVTGQADLHTAEQLRTQLMDVLWAEPPSVLVELGALEFCDLAGLDALHDAARAAHDAGVALTFRGMSTQLSWLLRTFPLHEALVARAPVRGGAGGVQSVSPAQAGDLPTNGDRTEQPDDARSVGRW